MLLADVRTKFKNQTSGLTASWEDTAIDGYLLPILTEFLPSDIDGKVHEVVWTKTLSPDVNPVVIPTNIISFPTGVFWIQGSGGAFTAAPTALEFYENHDDFVLRYPTYRDASDTGEPQAVYRSGSNLWLSRYPDTDYNLMAQARGSIYEALPASLPFNHAMALVTAAAWHFYLEQGDDESATRAAAQYETFKVRLLTDSWGDYRERTPNRSF